MAAEEANRKFEAKDEDNVVSFDDRIDQTWNLRRHAKGPLSFLVFSQFDFIFNRL